MCEIYRYSLSGVSDFSIAAEAHDGEEATNLLRQIQPDVLILDLVLPKKNGLDILKELPSLSPSTKVIVISSLENEAIINQAKALGAIVYLTKPFTKAQLVTAIEDISKHYSEVQNG
ncbi:response regulator transcription factor [bacterium]|nr:response regulator transcription factor [bacterium]